jgi:hypothetical protein
MSAGDAAAAAMRGISGTMGLKSGYTVRLDVDDAVQSLDLPAGPYGFDPSAAVVSCESGAVLFAFGIDPVREVPDMALGHKLYTGQAFQLEGISDLRNVRFTSAAAGVSAALQITYRY